MSMIYRVLRRIWRLCKTVLKQIYLYWGGRIASILQKNKKHKEDYPIDFVVTWVDGSDPDWIKEKQKYSSQMIEQASNTAARFRDGGTLVYWFRAVEKYAPWVNHVYLVTCGHKPSWLNLQNEKLRFVSYDDFMPKEYLPTFNTNPIELNMWRIPGLSEHFVYFNDDMFVNRPVKPEDFFVNGLPKECAIAKPLYVSAKAAYSQPWRHMLLNDYSVINGSFNIRESISRNPEKWFCYAIGSDAIYNRRLYFDGYLSGAVFPHVTRACLKKTFQDLWDKQGQVLDETSRNKFRSSSNITNQLVALWALFSGDFYPVSKKLLGVHFQVTSDSIERIQEELCSPKHNVICLNDDERILDSEFDSLKQRIIDAFLIKLPDKSSYEL